MKEKHIVMIIDKSGSMSSIGREAVQSCNEFLKRQKEEGGEDRFTLVYFNDHIDRQIVDKPLMEVDLIDEESYHPNGCTALLDCLGGEIATLQGKDCDAFFVVMTDGMENSSREFNYPIVKKMMSESEKRGWKFLFLASGIEAGEEGERLGMKHIIKGEHNGKGMRKLMCEASSSVSSWRKPSKKL